jgi:hypothetical protein
MEKGRKPLFHLCTNVATMGLKAELRERLASMARETQERACDETIEIRFAGCPVGGGLRHRPA